jgi:predicted dehydrogenase
MTHSIGLIGCGGISSVWVDAVSQTPDCEITKTFDVDAAAAVRKAEEIGAKSVSDLDELLASPDIDMVVIGTPTFTHADLVVKSAEAGKHVMCEKPMSLSLGECQRMIDACGAGGVKMAIGHSLRFWGAFHKTRQLISEGLIGTPVFGQIHRMGSAKIAESIPVDGEGSDRHWRFDTRYSGGNIPEGFIHELDFSRAIFGEVQSVYCESTGNQTYGDKLSPVVVQAFVDYQDGKTATVRMGGTVGYNWRGATICGTTGTLSFDNWGGPVYHHHPDKESIEAIECLDTLAYKLELNDLIQAIASDGEPENSGLNGKKDLGLCLAMYRSMELGKRMDFTNGIPNEVALDWQYLGKNSIR